MFIQLTLEKTDVAYRKVKINGAVRIVLVRAPLNISDFKRNAQLYIFLTSNNYVGSFIPLWDSLYHTNTTKES